MRVPLRMLFALLLGGAAALLVSCGQSNGLLSSSEGGSLGSALDGVSAAVSSHQCGKAASLATSLHEKIDALPPNVDHRLVASLQQGAITVNAEAQHDCAKPTTTQQTLQTQTTTSTPTVTQTTTVPAQTTSVPTTTPPPETTSTPTGTSPNGGAQPGVGTTGGGGAPGSGQ